MKLLSFLFAFSFFPFSSFGAVYFVSPSGSDQNDGSLEAPFATLGRAQSLVAAGDTVFFRAGSFVVDQSEIMHKDGTYARTFFLNKSGRKGAPICYFAYPGDDRPVFDFSNVRPDSLRVSAFLLGGSYLHLRGFDIVGVQVTIEGHTQSECVSARNGSYCIVENVAMHNGMAIGYYQTAGHNNLVLNCDAYENYDDFSEGAKGGNVDGFGGHVAHDSDTANVFRGCRAWFNSDDGFDLINARTPFTIDHCWSFCNGYAPNSSVGAGDGTGFKSGGYGMSTTDEVNAPAVIPMHMVVFCLAYNNRLKGFYANHHLGGIFWQNNSAYQNSSNFCMLCRESPSLPPVDVDGYGHVLSNNMSYRPRSSGAHLIDCDEDLCSLSMNTFGPSVSLGEPAKSDFLSLDWEELKNPRLPDGSLPDIDFLKAKAGSSIAVNNVGYAWQGGVADVSVLHDIHSLPGQPVCVYNLDGRLVLKSTCPVSAIFNELVPGVYVINGKLISDKRCLP